MKEGEGREEYNGDQEMEMEEGEGEEGKEVGVEGGEMDVEKEHVGLGSTSWYRLVTAHLWRLYSAAQDGD